LRPTRCRPHRPGTNLTLDYAGSSGKLLRARGALAVGFGSFFNASGTFDFERSTLNLGGTPTAVTMISATGASAGWAAGGVAWRPPA